METIKSNTSKVFDFIDNIDRYLYGRKMKNFIGGSIIVLIIAPILDWSLQIPYDRLTFLTTLLFIFYILTLFVAWISAWRDDNGQWTWKRTQSRLITYYEALRDTTAETKTKSTQELLYRLGSTLFFGAIIWKALANASVLVRKLVWLTLHKPMIKLWNFERTTNTWFWLVLIAGAGIIYYLYRTDNNMLDRIKRDLQQLFRGKQFGSGNYGTDAVKIGTDKLIISSRQGKHIEEIIANNTSTLFNDFVNAIKNWNPGNFNYEYEFQDKLYRYLKKAMPNTTIELEYPIGDISSGNKGRADIVINDTILIEMKKDFSAGAVQRAKGQILQYSDILRNRGPVVLLLCKYDYEDAKLNFTSTMVDLNKLERPVLTIVAER